ncbi:MAG TPA: 5'-methylthioadenosine/S-adenosylhomocysteine nucleosidase [Microvirga sp.]|jgi:adenosylhomocysteine nucleosidase|nr:5'-methylthioadenosine/S-adenosylhomocysteine nucleosidase [Microvirga sp.]
MILRLLCLAALVWGAADPARAQGLLDDKPRTAVVTAYEPEIKLLLARTSVEATHAVNGVTFTTGKLGGRDVVVFLSGISMVNAAMNAQLALDRFNVGEIVFSGIAGGVDPDLRIGDVVVAERWGQYLEAVYARETPAGLKAPPFAKTDFPPFGMAIPQPVRVRSASRPAGESRFWFDADPRLLDLARGIAAAARLERCAQGNACLQDPPRLVVGGNGVSGQAFVGNAAFREYTFKTFGARVLDMETAAVATVAYANGKPFIAFRSLSDLAGGGPAENEIGTFFQLAADNSARVVIAFLEALGR